VNIDMEKWTHRAAPLLIMEGHQVPRWFTNNARFCNAPIAFDPTRDPEWLGNEVQERLYGKPFLPPGTPRMPLRTVPLSEEMPVPPNKPERCSPDRKV